MKNNKSISCTVTECKNHSKEENFCSLNKIQIVKHSDSASNVEQTDCRSFQA
ncbi:hypothetical protein CSC2_22670 [Clostridium zeae]|uniref:DUF1540 domain-containing protein n=1 Tax=Clostridium zeae TaxID=2759022 RepID=A0ABQ1EAD3_9CLOT|nr:DUF1540 domain-containing protein [Clostridium zeae]GFZ31741.1 hypothetical protein CSC2_22670 [Clostridium zeae]